MKADFVGVWSANALSSSGSQEDETVVFRSDGAGWIEWKSLGDHNIEFFSWMPTSPGWYVLSNEERFERDPHNWKRYIKKEPSQEYEHLPISIQETDTATGVMLQLEMELTGWNAGLYGLITAEADSWPRPQTPT